jgi:hypothetical protein
VTLIVDGEREPSDAEVRKFIAALLGVDAYRTEG